MHHGMKLVLALCAAMMTAPVHAQQAANEQVANEQIAMMKQARALLKDLHPVSGDVRIPQAEALLHLGKDYYFLPADEAKKVLVDGWGNPPDSAEGVLGMVFPAGKTFVDDTWGAVVSFEPTGWVSDEDANSTDYDALLNDMRAGEAEVNARRQSAGYPAQHLEGWAQAPSYDPRAHSLIWARNVRFEGQHPNTLSYDVRLLGRRGVLSLNMITNMDKLAETRAAAAKFGSSAEFTPGARYADYQPGTDAKAEYGVAGLVAAGAGVAAAKKLGLLAIILGFGKKFLFLIIAGAAGLFALLRKRLGGGEPEQEVYYESAADAPPEEATPTDAAMAEEALPTATAAEAEGRAEPRRSDI